MLRIHFTADDLARTVVAAESDPLWEVLFSDFRLRERDPPLAFRPWLRAVAADRSRLAAARDGSRALRALAPIGPYFPDFLTPPAASCGLAEGLEELRATPRRELRGQLARLARTHRLPTWTRPLADGDKAAVVGLADALRGYHEAVIAPHRTVVGGPVAADHAHRMSALTNHGLEGLFASMRPLLRWRPPVLEVEYANDRDLRLDGRGLRLVPSYFCQRVPVALVDSALPPTLVYPIATPFRWEHPARSARARSLEALLGGTRSAVLRAARRGATTSQLARRVGTSVSSVSRHAAVLRDAGLFTSHRQDQAVFHALTPLGAALVEDS
jgi:hypothetical protein